MGPQAHAPATAPSRPGKEPVFPCARVLQTCANMPPTPPKIVSFNHSGCREFSPTAATSETQSFRGVAPPPQRGSRRPAPPFPARGPGRFPPRSRRGAAARPRQAPPSPAVPGCPTGRSGGAVRATAQPGLRPPGCPGPARSLPHTPGPLPRALRPHPLPPPGRRRPRADPSPEPPPRSLSPALPPGSGVTHQGRPGRPVLCPDRS